MVKYSSICILRTYTHIVSKSNVKVGGVFKWQQKDQEKILH